MIYIARDYNDSVLSVVMAKSEELAKAYWHGKNIQYNHVTAHYQNDLDNHPTGVIPIVNTILVSVTDYQRSARIRVIE